MAHRLQGVIGAWFSFEDVKRVGKVLDIICKFITIQDMTDLPI